MFLDPFIRQMTLTTHHEKLSACTQNYILHYVLSVQLPMPYRNYVYSWSGVHRSPWRLNFARQRLIFIVPQYGTCFMSTARILRNLLHFSKICALLFFIATCFGYTMLPFGLPRRFSHTKMLNEIQNVHCTYRPSTASLCHRNPAPTRPSRDTPQNGRALHSSHATPIYDAAMDPRTHCAWRV